ncbi:MAG: hypothetical protein ABSG84_07645 [Acidobacteriaceae bacterium]|jgi:hypothetical protein
MRNIYRSALRAWRLGLFHLIRRRFFLLFLFLLSSIVVYPYAESSGFGYYTFRVLMGGVILLTVYAVTFSRGMLFLVIALAIPSFLQHTFVHPHDAGMVPELSRAISLAFYVVVIFIIFRHVFENDKPNSETMFGALCIYLLIGFAFSSAYMVIAGFQPHAFNLSPAVNLHTVPDRFDFVYFSFGTLTELGAPGITAVVPVARSISLLESIIGILYLAILISRLNHTVTTAARDRKPRDRRPIADSHEM